MADPGEVERATSYGQRPWLGLHRNGLTRIDPEYATALEMARAGLATAGDEPLVWYFDAALSGREIDEQSDALACALLELGAARGDRVALYLQNMPQFVVAVVALWKIAAVAVPMNPMLRERELGPLLRDSGASILISLDDLYASRGSRAIQDTSVRTVMTTSALDHLDGQRPAVLAEVERVRSVGTQDFAELVETHRGHRPPAVEVSGEDVALLVYTSGTTGPPKGAMILHRNVVFSSTVFREWAALTPRDVILGLAPLFHITGFIADLGTALATPAAVVLTCRFDPAETLGLIARRRASFCVAAITAYIALLNDPALPSTDTSSLRAAFSGGAPVPAAIVEAWEAATGTYVHNAYGLTETTAPTHLVPLGARAPVDPDSGALSVGVPVFQTSVEVVDEQGRPSPVGQIGELVTSGPQVIPGYWGKPEETEHALPDGRLRTGDVGFMDDAGWFYIVDRSKDLIVAAGYKVWPREVEDVLYEHPAVREAAVIGVPDPYRGETVKAFVSFKPGLSAGEEELIGFCRSQLAAYKAPRTVVVLDALPTTATGKILRRELRRHTLPAGG